MISSTLQPAAAVAVAPAVALRDVRKVHGKGDGAVVALDGVTVALPRGSFTAIMGPSGSGKSTFLNVAAGLGPPTSRAVTPRGVGPAGGRGRGVALPPRARGRVGFPAVQPPPSLAVAPDNAPA